MKHASHGLSLMDTRRHKRVFLDEMDRVVPWAAFVALVEPHAAEGDKCRPPLPAEVVPMGPAKSS